MPAVLLRVEAFKRTSLQTREDGPGQVHRIRVERPLPSNGPKQVGGSVGGGVVAVASAAALAALGSGHAMCPVQAMWTSRASSAPKYARAAVGGGGGGVACFYSVFYRVFNSVFIETKLYVEWQLDTCPQVTWHSGEFVSIT